VAHPNDDREVEVHVQSLKTNAKTHFKVAESAALEAVWATASDAAHLAEPRSDGDTFRCKDGTDLTNQLSSTLAQLEAQGICHGRQFEIRGPSGGA
jgi:hypothetical protein